MYVLGDSFSFGHNFWQEKRLDRNELIYPHFLSQKLNCEVKNLSVPGGSNWRISRLLNNLNLNENDYVIIGWTNVNRFEIGYNKTSLLPKDNLYTLEQLEESTYEDDKNIIIHGFEKDKNVITAKLLPGLYHSTFDIIPNMPLKNLVSVTYQHFNNAEWLENMFLVFFNSAVYKCLRARCKFIMFNVYWKTHSTSCELLDIPEYFLGYNNNMTSFLRPNYKEKFTKYGMDYWSEDEHIQVAELLHSHLKKIYNS